MLAVYDSEFYFSTMHTHVMPLINHFSIAPRQQQFSAPWNFYNALDAKLINFPVERIHVISECNF